VLLSASRTYDVRALEGALDAAFGAASFEHVVDEWLMAAMAEVGEAWASGNLHIAQEHFITAGVMRRIAAAFSAAGHARNGPHIVTGLAPGANHEIGTLAFATMLRRAGLRVTHLGADLPVESWVEAVRTIRPDAVVIGAPRTTDTSAATEVVEALKEDSPQSAVYVGGPGAPPEYATEGSTLAQASDWLAETLSRS
jgi:MerR family transcriptional regulator, light-induced transcriptional regulator